MQSPARLARTRRGDADAPPRRSVSLPNFAPSWDEADALPESLSQQHRRILRDLLLQIQAGAEPTRFLSVPWPSVRVRNRLLPFVRMEEAREGAPQAGDLESAPSIPSLPPSAAGTAAAAKKRAGLSTGDWLAVLLSGALAVLVAVALIVWSFHGLRVEEGLGREHALRTRLGVVRAPLRTTPARLALRRDADAVAVLDVRVVAMALEGSAAEGVLSYSLLADGVEVARRDLVLSPHREVEHFETFDTRFLGSSIPEAYSVNVTARTSDGGETVAFLCQVIEMGCAARYRVAIGISIFAVTVLSIIVERIHRSYSAFIGASVALCALAAIQETPELQDVANMIDWGTLVLLGSMMILMQLLAMVGFFKWFAVFVVGFSNGSPSRLFCSLTMVCGVLSMLLDNVTVVLLVGPLAHNVAKRMRINPRPLYLSLTICATVGGAATMIGDPPNIVIGSKMDLGFEKFLIVNLPIVGFALLPISGCFLHSRLSASLCPRDWVCPSFDLAALRDEHKITMLRQFYILCTMLLTVLMLLLLSPFHGIEPGWFTLMAMIASALAFDCHHLSKFLEFVEWDTLFFFASLFVLVESLSMLGVIQAIGFALVGFINVFPDAYKMHAAVITVLWISSLGSAFLESLPYTTTVVYVILDFAEKAVPGVRPHVLCWPLSIGACIGGIGSIMGSSANLVCVAVANRFGESDDEKVQGKDFIKYGFPLLLVLTSVSTLWLLFLLVWVEFDP
eukprot:TRINITY_DN32938_c0_g1_i1.p1 TRINITY_DN32938_c0_g1~~TRINITY_DN32938_c0_g1_i1.p1  ORF type:complete len:759 (-),score=109.24 TRINITY_DN32938_c0_g1_i1:279-2483(-)